MDTRKLGFLGLGALGAIIVVTLAGVPPAVWITLALVGVGIGITFVIREAQADGVDVANRIVVVNATQADGAPPTTASTDTSAVSVELVRAADERTGAPAVWLHRCGGRRVHRYSSEDGWVVQQVSTKDPDNPKLRTIGDAHSFATESEAILAAGDLAQGVAPATRPEPRPSGRQVMASAEA